MIITRQECVYFCHNSHNPLSLTRPAHKRRVQEESERERGEEKLPTKEEVRGNELKKLKGKEEADLKDRRRK